MKIIFAGGGTLGSVSPLVAIFEEIKKDRPQTEFLWLATKNGREIELIKNYQIPYREIFSGKFRRYFSGQNLIDPLLVFIGFCQSFFIILKFKPDVIVSAGGFVAVPVVWASWLLRKKSIIHQQDVLPGLANKLMATFASKITVTFAKSLAAFSRQKTVLVGNPVRADILSGSQSAGYDYFKLDQNRPVVLFMGGGTGALNLNKLVISNLKPLLEFCQIIHLTGGKINQAINYPHYRQFEFLIGQLKNAYAISDLVVSRAGLGTLTEISALKKPAILIPIPGTHQELNAMEFFKSNACALLDEKKITPGSFVSAIKTLLFDPAELDSLSRNVAKIMPIDAAAKIAAIIYEIGG
jgi:UDP-N-acetylglucosamine--N-acetylmuramyl-(pentapeptide) pyrophosphoryl-undecaprenol N-acetylglucosamine transferase